MDYQEYIYWQGLAIIGRYPDIRIKARFQNRLKPTVKQATMLDEEEQ